MINNVWFFHQMTQAQNICEQTKADIWKKLVIWFNVKYFTDWFEIGDWVQMAWNMVTQIIITLTELIFFAIQG